MYPILVELPSKLLFVLALVLAAVSFGWNMARRRRKERPSSTPLMLLAGAWLLLGLRAGTWVPSVEVFSAGWEWKSVPIFSYGVMLGTAMLVGWFLALRLARHDGISGESAGAVYMWTAIWSIVGARVLYVVTQPHEFTNPLDVVMLNRGGLVAYGGMLGGFFASWYTCRKRGIQLLRWADAAAPSVVLGTAITRVGCLLFGCDYGRVTDVPWAIRFPKGRPAWIDHVASHKLAEDAALSLPVHPTQIYEILAGLAIFGLVMFLRRVRRFSGEVFVGWVLGYGVLRSLIEIYRGDDDRGLVGILSTSQIIGIASVLAGFVLLVVLIKRARIDPAAARLWEIPIAPPTPVRADAAPGRGRQRRPRR